ncbi:TlpA family protein disulfide reductase [Methylomonas paludis]|uniref:TlpA family protein disulfide reductase n=1 Tax=Methylomonas paludis TaxID=1173101 RepID=A0A975RAX6_9GAMM|nr:TlpA disulfide reductase family protein [Methylomonas paludis]QWF71764.1 TlpA family protein disulfide reductase [Methylomonas paludis]
MTKKTVIFLAIAALALLAGIFAQRIQQLSEQTAATAPPIEFSLPDIDDKPHAISEWRGKFLVVNFWASWCGPCIKEIPEFINMQTELQAQGVQFIGVAIEEKAAVLDYLARVHINYPILVAGEAGLSLAYRLGNIINAVPFSIIVNPTGQIIHHQPGELSKDKLLSVLAPLLNKPKAE